MLCKKVISMWAIWPDDSTNPPVWKWDMGFPILKTVLMIMDYDIYGTIVEIWIQNAYKFPVNLWLKDMVLQDWDDEVYNNYTSPNPDFVFKKYLFLISPVHRINHYIFRCGSDVPVFKKEIYKWLCPKTVY